MMFPEYVWMIFLGILLLCLPLSHARTLWYKLRRRKWIQTHVRIIVFHLNHTISSAWIPVDEKDGNSKIVTYLGKTYLYKVERVYRLPPSFGLYAREPFMMCLENNPDPLDMMHIMKQMQAHKTPDELYQAVNTKVFIDMMKGVQDNKNMMLLIVGAIIIGLLFFFFNSKQATGGA